MANLSRLWWSLTRPKIHLARKSNLRFLALKLHFYYHRYLRGQRGIDVMGQDWDNLIILDACRYDSFVERYNDWENLAGGDLKSVISRGSSTSEFLDGNFQGREFPDTVYVSANHQIARLKTPFYRRVRIYEDEHRLFPDVLDDPPLVAMPETVVEAALDARRAHPDKRLIVHFLQPHAPYLGKTGKEIHAITDPTEAEDVWYAKLRDGELSRETVVSAYLENLEIVLKHVNTLVGTLPGKTVVTADHGEAFGERGVYAHPGGKFVEELVKVPWLTVDRGNRPEIQDGDSTDRGEGLDDDIRARLADLGYVEFRE